MKTIKKIITIILVVSLLVCTVGCRKDENEDDVVDTPVGSIERYAVKVSDTFGRVLPDVRVFVHRDNGSDYNICSAPVFTDADGYAYFDLDNSFEYSVELSSFSMAYVAKSGENRANRYPLVSSQTEIVLSTNPSYRPDYYNVGDLIADIGLVSVNGVEYNIYDVLREKKAIILNFWFCECIPCALEFPALNRAYCEYSDSIEVFALNDTDNAERILAFPSEKRIEMSFPTFARDMAPFLNNDMFFNRGYPNTVVIDRYGVVSFIHSGSMTSVDSWSKIIEYYISDSYDGTPLRSINDLDS